MINRVKVMIGFGIGLVVGSGTMFVSAQLSISAIHTEMDRTKHALLDTRAILQGAVLKDGGTVADCGWGVAVPVKVGVPTHCLTIVK